MINSNVSNLLPLTCINLMNRSNVGQFCLNNLPITFHGQSSFEFLKNLYDADDLLDTIRKGTGVTTHGKLLKRSRRNVS